MNADSSRSHSVFSLNFDSKVQSNGMIHVKSSKLHFVDLAGSERQKSTGSAGDRLKEASNINKSLTVLGIQINLIYIFSFNFRSGYQCISGVGERKESPHSLQG